MNIQEKFSHIVEMQDSLNEHTVKNWREADLDWDTAILTETAENIESCGWKWWKAETPDVANMKVETIDLLHFLSSKSMLIHGNDKTVEKLLDAKKMLDQCPASVEPVGTLKSLLVHALSNNMRDAFGDMFSMFAYLDMDVNDIYSAYISKNLLNAFRKNNGYNDPDATYIKVFKDGREDNEVFNEIFSIVSTDAENSTLDELKESAFMIMSEKVNAELSAH